MPLIFNRTILDTVSVGSAIIRNRAVEAIVKQANEKVILGGGPDDFNNWLSSHQ